MKIENVISGCLFVIFSLIFLTNTDKLPLGTSADIGPGFFPTVIAVCLLVVGLTLIFKKTND